jgi:hypothetical protein
MPQKSSLGFASLSSCKEETHDSENHSNPRENKSSDMHPLHIKYVLKGNEILSLPFYIKWDQWILTFYYYLVGTRYNFDQLKKYSI